MLRQLVVACLIIISCATQADDLWQQAEPSTRVGKIAFRPCELSNLQGRRNAECAYFDVAENEQDPQGRHIQLFVVRLPAEHSKPKADPVLLIDGGPGEGASNDFLFFDKVFSKAARERDFYLIDQRGTGRSHALQCKQNEGDLNANPAAEYVRRRAQECLQSLDADVRYYTTSVAVRDFEKIRQALQVSQWNLLGISYGTRVEQEYLRRFPQSIRSAVLDSVVPAAENLGPLIPEFSQNALDLMYRQCAADKACAKRYPKLKEETEALLKSLTNSPATVDIENIKTENIDQVAVTSAHLLSLIRLSLYNTQTVAMLPTAIHAAVADGNYAPLYRRATLIFNTLSDNLALGMHNSVICTEDVPFYSDKELEQASKKPSYLGGTFVEILKNTCSVWPQGIIDDDFKAPLKSAVPSLVLSGEYDPITPPAWAAKVAQGLSNSRHLTLKGQGHAVSVEGCAPTIVAKFLDELNPESLDAECLNRVEAAPFFIDFNGPGA